MVAPGPGWMGSLPVASRYDSECTAVGSSGVAVGGFGSGSSVVINSFFTTPPSSAIYTWLPTHSIFLNLYKLKSIELV